MPSISEDIEKHIKESPPEKEIQKKQYYIIYQKFLKENVEIVKDDIQRMKTLNDIDIFNYHGLYCMIGSVSIYNF